MKKNIPKNLKITKLETAQSGRHEKHTYVLNWITELGGSFLDSFFFLPPVPFGSLFILFSVLTYGTDMTGGKEREKEVEGGKEKHLDRAKIQKEMGKVKTKL